MCSRKSGVRLPAVEEFVFAETLSQTGKKWMSSGEPVCRAVGERLPSAYAYISLLYSFNYNTVPVPSHTHSIAEKAESFFPCYANIICLKTV